MDYAVTRTPRLWSWGGPVQDTNRIPYGIAEIFTISLGIAAAALALTLLIPRIELSSDWERGA